MSFSGVISSIFFTSFVILVLMAIVEIIKGIFCRTSAHQTCRASVSKTFVVGSIFTALVMFLAALATMPLTRHYQNEYYRLKRVERLDEVRFLLGEKWPRVFSGLPADIFSVDDHPDAKP